MTEFMLRNGLIAFLKVAVEFLAGSSQQNLLRIDANLDVLKVLLKPIRTEVWQSWEYLGQNL